MTEFEKAALAYLVWGWKVAVACAAVAVPGPLRDPWNQMGQQNREAIQAAVDAGHWPQDVALTERVPDHDE